MNCKKARKNKILLAIPAYNEEKYLEQVLDSVGQYADNILVLDDGSTDNTKKILASRDDVCFVSHSCNHGYGQVTADIFYFANSYGYDWVITIDCDLQHEPGQIPNFIKAIEANDADIISGSRYMSDSEIIDLPPNDRRHINQQMVNLLNDRLNLEITDAFCGYKAYRSKAVAELSLTEKCYGFPMEFWVQAVEHGLRIKEIPISLIYNDPERHFGGQLDDPKKRLNHYLAIFEKSIQKTQFKSTETISIYGSCKRKIPDKKTCS